MSGSRWWAIANIVVMLASGLIGFRIHADERLPSPEPADAVFISRSAARLGFSVDRLSRIGTSYATGVASGEIPGAVVLIARKGEVVYANAIGFRNVVSHVAMTRDTRFALASMTKPITSVAAMMLVEEGRLQLDAPVSRYLPELADLKVGREVIDPVSGAHTLELEATRRPATIHDLLRHTAGFTYGPFGSSLVQQAYLAANLTDVGQNNAELINKLARLPLAYQPGQFFEYSMSTDVLGRVIEIVSGMPLAQFIEQRITIPLGMRDTSFGVPDTARIALVRTASEAPLSGTPRWASGGAGLIGTADDYLKFAQMLLNGGELGGKRLLSPKTIELMISNHLPANVVYGPYDLGVLAPTADLGQGFGLGFCVRIDAGRNPVPGSVGDYSWAGSSGTYFWIDPRERLVAIVLTAAPEVRAAYRARARALVYQAMVN